MSKLVSTNKSYFLLVYETKEAMVNDVVAATDGHYPLTAAFFSKKLNCHVWYAEPGDVFLVLEEDKNKQLLKVLHRNRVGWICNYKWIDLRETYA